MIEPTPRASDLEAGLAEIDQRLQQLHDELDGADPSGASREPTADASREPAAIAPAEPDLPKRKRQGRSGPLAAVLQRGSRQSAEREAPPPAPDAPAHASPEPPPPPAPPPPVSETPAPPPPVREEPGARLQLDQSRERLQDLEQQLDALSTLRDKLLTSIQELLDGYQAVVQAHPSPARQRTRSASAKVTLSAGPFSSLSAVHAFERAVAALPGVDEASLRGYEGENRAIVDVQLGHSEITEAPHGSLS
jgi:hypothetical protein